MGRRSGGGGGGGALVVGLVFLAFVGTCGLCGPSKEEKRAQAQREQRRAEERRVEQEQARARERQAQADQLALAKAEAEDQARRIQEQRQQFLAMTPVQRERALRDACVTDTCDDIPASLAVETAKTPLEAKKLTAVRKQLEAAAAARRKVLQDAERAAQRARATEGRVWGLLRRDALPDLHDGSPWLLLKPRRRLRLPVTRATRGVQRGGRVGTPPGVDGSASFAAIRPDVLGDGLGHAFERRRRPFKKHSARLTVV